MGKRVLLVSSVPEIGYDVPTANFVAAVTGRDANAIVMPTTEEFQQRVAGVSAVMQTLQEELSVELIKPEELLCSDGYCRVNVGENSLYRDDDHLSTFGAKYLSPLFSRALAGITGS